MTPSGAAATLDSTPVGPLVTVSFPALGTTATVVAAGSEQQGLRAANAVRAELAAIDLACSRFRPDSELSRLNAARGRPVPASPLLLEAVEVALRAARLTSGLVDPTVGGTLRRLGYDRDFASLGTKDPADEPLARDATVTLVARRAPGWRVVDCDRGRGTITLPDGVELDLGATAKALAADRAAAGAERVAGCPVLVSLGGDIAVAGLGPARGWPVRVTDDHAAGVDEPGQTVSVVAGGLATSGTTVAGATPAPRFTTSSIPPPANRRATTGGRPRWPPRPAWTPTPPAPPPSSSGRRRRHGCPPGACRRDWWPPAGPSPMWPAGRGRDHDCPSMGASHGAAPAPAVHQWDRVVR
jgi:FAD:protein FMN transferase